MHTRRFVTALLVLFVPAITYAQQTSPSDSMPRAGTWAAEIGLGSAGAGASLLRFQSPRFALLFGADFNVTRVEDDSDASTLFGQTGTQTGFAARLGGRSYRESSSERIRPVVGFGARAGYTKGLADFRTWSTGIYGELGAMYFVTPHLSLGGTGELQANYGKQKRTVSPTQTIEQTTTSFGGSLVRVMLSVYF